MNLVPFVNRAPLVTVLRLTGVISPSPQPLRGTLSLSQVSSAIHHAFSARGVKAVALAINSPGGSPVQSSLIAKRVRAMAKEKDVPVFAFIEDVAASGGYWLACAADEIFADKTSIVGSIGVVSAGFGFQDAIKKLGVERRVHVQGRNKALLDPFRPEDPEDVARLEEIQSDMHAVFIDHVRERRGRRLKGEDDTLFNGDVWTGTRARDLGLVDGIGDLRSVLRERFGEKVKLRLVSSQRGWLRRQLGMGRDGGLPAAEDLAAGLIGALEHRAAWARFGL